MSENMQFALLVVAIGLIVVFGVLILSTFLIYLYGKIITFAQGKASDEKKKSVKKEPASLAAPLAPVPRREDENELMAVIAAAVHEIYAGTGRQYVVKRVKRASCGRPAWATAGLLDSTRPF